MNYTLIHCLCKEAKIYRLTFDGGSTGNYLVELCFACYKNQDKSFLITEEVVAEIDGQASPNSISVKELYNDCK